MRSILRFPISRRPGAATGLRAGALLLFSSLLAPATAQEASGPPLDSIEQRALPCTVCHGREGRATPDGYYPRIAGKPPGYLYNQLVHFRDGHRNFPLMTYLVERQTDAFLRELADYFGNLHLPYSQPPVSPASDATLARGRELVTQGDESLKVPACNSCHGSNLLGVLPSVPGLLGLAPDYVFGQLGAWRNGTRRATEPDCMAEIARRLRPQDIQAAGAWLATQTVPDDASPSEHLDREPTMACGSMPQTEHLK